MPNTPNMGMNLPVVGVTPGGGGSGHWGPLLTESLGLVDSHDHSPGHGAPLSVTAPQFIVKGDLDFGGHSLLDIKNLSISGTAYLSGSIISSGTIFAPQLTGSLTQISGGLAYLIGVGGITVATNSLGQVLVSASVGDDRYASYILAVADAENPNARVISVGSGSNATVVFTDAGPGGSFGIGVRVYQVLQDQGNGKSYTTASINAYGGLTGSLTQTSTGLAYMVGIGGVTITTNSLGQVIVSGAAGAVTDIVGAGGSTVSSVGSDFTVSSSIGADAYASYLLASASAQDTKARTIAGLGGTSVIDNGAGSTLQVSSAAPPWTTIVGQGGTSVSVTGATVFVSSSQAQSQSFFGQGGTSVSIAGPFVTISSSVPLISQLAGQGGTVVSNVGSDYNVSSSVGSDKYGTFLVLSASANDPNVRRLVVGGTLTAVDLGAGSTYTISAAFTSASQAPYTPATGSNWNLVPTTVQGALDQLAAPNATSSLAPTQNNVVIASSSIAPNFSKAKSGVVILNGMLVVNASTATSGTAQFFRDSTPIGPQMALLLTAFLPAAFQFGWTDILPDNLAHAYSFQVSASNGTLSVIANQGSILVRELN